MQPNTQPHIKADKTSQKITKPSKTKPNLSPPHMDSYKLINPHKKP